MDSSSRQIIESENADKYNQNAIDLLEISLLKSSFNRIDDVVIIGEENNSFNLNVDINELDDNIIKVILTIRFNSEYKNETQLEINVVYLGKFKVKGERPAFFEEFCKVNAPAILYPFAREEVANLSMKAGIRPILLPPFNFVAFAKEESKSKNN